MNLSQQPELGGQIHLAPMEGVLDFILRGLLCEIGGFAKAVTEFIRVTDRPVSCTVLLRDCPELAQGGRTTCGNPVFVQFLGGKPSPIAESAALAVGMGALGIDLNFGCPAKTVNRHDGGATLLKNPHRLFDVVSTVRRAVPPEIPVTAKLRLGFDHKWLCRELAQAVSEAQASSLTVHARTRSEMYTKPAHWEFIARMREVCTIPIIANGEIWNEQDYQLCRSITGCRDVAIGRGALASPDLGLRLSRMACGSQTSMTARPLQWQALVQKYLPSFLKQCNTFGGPTFALARIKQWCKYLSLGYAEANALFTVLKTCSTLVEAEVLLQKECYERCENLHLDRMPLLPTRQGSFTPQGRELYGS